MRLNVHDKNENIQPFVIKIAQATKHDYREPNTHERRVARARTLSYYHQFQIWVGFTLFVCWIELVILSASARDLINAADNKT